LGIIDALWLFLQPFLYAAHCCLRLVQHRVGILNRGRMGRLSRCGWRKAALRQQNCQEHENDGGKAKPERLSHYCTPSGGPRRPTIKANTKSPAPEQAKIRRSDRLSATHAAPDTPSDWPMNRKQANSDMAAPRAAGAIWVALVCSVLCRQYSPKPASRQATGVHASSGA